MRLLRRVQKHVTHSLALLWRMLKPVLHRQALLRLVLHSRVRQG
jgi:hypothetical protein